MIGVVKQVLGEPSVWVKRGRPRSCEGCVAGFIDAVINVNLKERTENVLHTLSLRDREDNQDRLLVWRTAQGTRWRRLARPSRSRASAMSKPTKLSVKNPKRQRPRDHSRLEKPRKG